MIPTSFIKYSCLSVSLDTYTTSAVWQHIWDACIMITENRKVCCHLYRWCLYVIQRVILVLTRVPRIEQHIEISVRVPWSALFSQISHYCCKGAEAANDAAGVRCYAHCHVIALHANHATLPAPITFLSSDGHNDVGTLVFIRCTACEDRCIL